MDLEIDHAADQAERLTPEGVGIVHEIHHVAHGFDKLLHLDFGDHQGRRHFQHHEVVAADLGENALIAKQPHHQDLAEERRGGCGGSFRRRRAGEAAGAR